MCGIVGALAFKGSAFAVTENYLGPMRDVMAHRGPDGAGVWVSPDGRVGLGHRRLSIIDLSTAATQPMCNEDGSLWVSFNGEIYNHLELAHSLRSRGHEYRTSCDTESIIHQYEEDGERVVESLRGMFAFAIWDKKKRQLLLARDRLGVKPLYYVHNSDGTLCFASEIKSLLEAGVEAQVNFQALPDYLANRSVSGDQTLFANVRKLLPGNTLVWPGGKVTIRLYRVPNTSGGPGAAKPAGS